MQRFIDLMLAIALSVFLSPLWLAILLFNALFNLKLMFKQTRVGRHQQPFTLYKFRTMRLNTGSVPSHQANPNDITKLGAFLRSTKLDELPQLWNVIKGEMSLVGPRPNLPIQNDLVEQRALHGVYEVRPGITGLSQIRGIDMSTPKLLARMDALMIRQFSIKLYCWLLVVTFLGKGRGDAINSK